MNKPLKSFATLALCLSLAHTPAQGVIEVLTDITPQHMGSTHSELAEILKEDFKTLLQLFQKSDQKNYAWRMSYFTPREARGIFEHQARESLQVTEAETLDAVLDRLFSDTYFGESQGTSTDLSDQEILDLPTNQRIVSASSNLLMAEPMTTDSLDVQLYGDAHQTHFKSYFDYHYEQFFKNQLFQADPRVFFIDAQTVRDHVFSKAKITFEKFKETQHMYKNSNNYSRFTFLELTDENLQAEYERRLAIIFNPKIYGVPKDTAERDALAIQRDMSFLTQALINNTYKTACNIMAATQPGDVIVTFGNTPYFLGRALEKMGTDANPRTFVTFPFSGSPNRVRAMNFRDNRNFTTPDRVTHLSDRLRQIGLSPDSANLDGKKVYFMDVIASGSGVDFTLRQMIRDFRAANKPLPDLNILAINQIRPTDPDDIRNSHIAHGDIKDGETGKLYFPTKENPLFSIDTHVHFLPGHGAFDNLPSDAMRVIPEYNPSYWVHEYADRLTQPHAPHINTLLEFFDTNIAHLRGQQK